MCVCVVFVPSCSHLYSYFFCAIASMYVFEFGYVFVFARVFVYDVVFLFVYMFVCLFVFVYVCLFVRLNWFGK